MKYTQLAIEKAVEGGYDPVKNPYAQSKIEDFIFLDPTFWLSLGKSLGKDEGDMMYIQWHDKHPIHNPPETQKWTAVQPYDYMWYCFITHLASGKNAESFFEDLLNK